MNENRTAHIISHTHWDREWYLPYEKHHVLLVELMDNLLDTLDRDDGFSHFYLDGQTIIIDDYLQVRPDQRERLERYIRSGHIAIGPWYVLQDAFLTSSEANVRNLQIGHQDASRYDTIAKIGYFPDTFGNIGQAPQILKQAGINNAVFGRGVKPTGFNNSVSDSDYESSFSELIWEGPDGSQVLGILFANWYCNGMEIPVDPSEASKYWESRLSDAEKYAATNQLLFMNGCDHQPIQQDLTHALDTARALFPDTTFVHSSFEEYISAVQQSLGQQLSIVKGELRSQRTDGWSTLVNTASARVYLKQMNHRGQTALEKVAEPLATMAHTLTQSYDYPHHLFTYAWKTLMQNHPHDSICGCSVDEVHREMVTRFDKSHHVTESIIDKATQTLSGAIDTTVFQNFGEQALPFVVFNTTGWQRSGTVSVELDVERIYYREGVPLTEMNQRMKSVDIRGRVLVDLTGAQIAYSVDDLGLQFGYDLPSDAFRQPYMCRRIKLTFHASQIPALGYATYAWVARPETATPASEPVVIKDRRLENESIRVVVADNGSFDLLDKRNGQLYSGLGIYENTGDIGNEYMYKQPNGEKPLTTADLQAEIRMVEQTPYRSAIEIVHHWSVPASADERLEQEKQEAIYFPDREAQRSSEMVPLTISTVISLEADGQGLDVNTSFNNQAKDHRVRVLFPTDLQTPSHQVDSIFEIARRDNEPAAEWNNPSNDQHQQAFVDMSTANAGLTVANHGLHEYEIVRDERHTIAVTLLRSVSELGDWGVFPTPEAQCLGEHSFNLRLIPHSGDGVQSGAYREAYQFQIPWTVCQTSVQSGTLRPRHAFVHWDGSSVAFSSLKVSEDSGDLMLRWFNMTNQSSTLSVRMTDEWQSGKLYKSNILEQVAVCNDEVESAGATYTADIKACEIVTLGVNGSNKG